jgi:hypothetical protein
MPSYLTDVLGFDLGSAGMLSVFPFIALFAASVGFGRLFNHLQLHYGWKVNTVRQVSMYVSYFGSCGSLIICAYITDKYTAYGFMILSQVSISSSIFVLSFIYFAPTLTVLKFVCVFKKLRERSFEFVFVVLPTRI